MGQRNKKYKPRPFESATADENEFARIYESMLTHPAFIGLKTRQKILYLYVKAQFYGKRKPQSDFKDIPQFQGDDCFYFNFGLAVRYGLYTKTGNKEFYADMKALCETGFIECISSGKFTKTRSIYRFSSEWKKAKSVGVNTPNASR